MTKALAVLFLLVVAGIGYLVWKGAGVVAPKGSMESLTDRDATAPDLGLEQKARDAANEVADKAKGAVNKAAELLDNNVKSLKADKAVVEVKPGAKADVKITREGGAMKRLKLDMRIAADSKLTASGGEFKDGEAQATVTIEAQTGITADSAITISAGEKAKLILPVKVK